MPELVRAAEHGGIDARWRPERADRAGRRRPLHVDVVDALPLQRRAQAQHVRMTARHHGDVAAAQLQRLLQLRRMEHHAAAQHDVQSDAAVAGKRSAQSSDRLAEVEQAPRQARVAQNSAQQIDAHEWKFRNAET